MSVIENLKKAIEVLESPHIREVKVTYRGMFDDVRYYDAETHNGQHKYQVKVQDWFCDESNEMQRWARCNCSAGAKDMACRHVLKVAEVDSEMLKKDLFLETFASYKAHAARPVRLAA
jgi:hypothetical protein